MEKLKNLPTEKEIEYNRRKRESFNIRKSISIVQRKMFINIELKDDRLQLTFDKVIEVVEKYNMIEQIAFSSFKHGYYDIICHYCHEKNHQIEFGFLYHDKSKKEKFIPYRFDINGKVTMNIKYKEITK